MADINVGAVGGNEPKKQVQPGLITEHQVKKEINANPAQRPPEETEGVAAEALLNEPFYNALGLNLTTFDEKGNASKLDKSKTSYDVLKLEIEKTERQRELLEVELPQLKIEHVKGWFDDTKAIPRTDDPEKLPKTIEEVGASSGEVADVVGKRYHTETNDELAEAVGNITDDMLFNMINKSDYDDAQKERLRAGLEDAYGKKMTELAAEFGIHVDASGLQDLKEDCTREDVEAQLEILNKMLEDMPDEAAFEAMVKEKKDNIEAHIGVDFEENAKNPTRIGGLVATKFEENDKDPAERTKAGEKRLQKTLDELGKLQNADIDDYVKMKKLELLKDSMGKVRAEVQKLRNKLDLAVTELKQMEEFEADANKKRDNLLKVERKDYRAKVKEARAKRVASEKASAKVGTAEKHDKKKEEFTKDVEKATQVDVKTAKGSYDAAIVDENKALEQMKIAGFGKDQSHVARYIDHFFETKEIDKEMKNKLKEALESYTLKDADKFRLIADWIKFDDQSGEAIRKKAQTKISTETKMSEITPESLLFLLQTVKGMDLELKTTKQKAAAKEAINEALEAHQKEAKDAEAK